MPTDEEIRQKTFEVSRVFTPATAINREALFAGRTKQRIQVIDAINQPGQHAIIFGERGVGKTSLVQMLAPWLESLRQTVRAPRVNCDSTDTFSSVWHKVFLSVPLPGQTQRPGFGAAGVSELASSD